MQELSELETQAVEEWASTQTSSSCSFFVQQFPDK